MMEYFLKRTQRKVISIGKIFDIFSGVGIFKIISVHSVSDIFSTLISEAKITENSVKEFLFFL